MKVYIRKAFTSEICLDTLSIGDILEVEWSDMMFGIYSGKIGNEYYFMNYGIEISGGIEYKEFEIGGESCKYLKMRLS